ncbi:HAD family phosphatase [Streptomyces ipomoeae]|jgi:HAD superfamily hydrolase (TIGR01509 family)|uniref:HAD hydrolase, family IA, variant 3 n=2 Tax=Streptomyces ipomoeae TaxID=103232 RepID=L1L553_9ACTN|nr:HAD family phosphatase [Streptomyces ipomoeae]EKX68057.1 HAD hydrolase, family IA, variant 3 [Streptomyces ipomoeae 91-03]MDX2696899.1 HAD family phosphatase [Streptomyces ipomoeae]MDX2824081.1 HAD family phosphatase [Streptomyces ipomoeae]MDX2842592.1 HAD family phosphatase [Streptomyces ipomoeae]MDX2872145.1 HAD family phosphatase [Streptomyces ipomoeae]
MSTLGGTSVIFDLDGTLVDSEPNYYEASRRTLAAHGVTDFSWAEHERFVGISTRETVATWRERYGFDVPVEALLAEKNRHYLELARTATRVYPEMRKFVELLAAEGVPMAVASGSSREAIEVILAGTGLGAYLRTVVSADEVAQGKPAPDVFLEAARRLGVAPAGCVVMEDAVPGAVAAHAAGMRCVAIPYVAEQADDPAFATAGLLVRGGQGEFTARDAYDWIAASR